MESTYFCLLARTVPTAFSHCDTLRKTLNSHQANGNCVLQTKHFQPAMGLRSSACRPVKLHFGSVGFFNGALGGSRWGEVGPHFLHPSFRFASVFFLPPLMSLPHRYSLLVRKRAPCVFSAGTTKTKTKWCCVSGCPTPGEFDPPGCCQQRALFSL